MPIFATSKQMSEFWRHRLRCHTRLKRSMLTTRVPTPSALPPMLTRRLAFAMLAAAVWGRDARAESGLSFVMLERHGCPFCVLWLREIGPIWPRSDLGRRAPLRRVDIGAGPLPEDLAFLRDVQATPTFVLLENGVERGRIVGYQGDVLFWQEAEALFATLRR